MARRLLVPLIALQAAAHLFWLSPAAHSGQVAIPWLMNRGWTLFGDIWEQHAPGSSVLAALAQRLAPTIDPGSLVKGLNALLVIAFTLVIFSLAKRLTGSERAGLLAALVWAWLEPVYGNILLYFDSLLALCLLLALCIYFRRDAPRRPRDALLLGLMMGGATLFKQQAWLAVALMGLWLLCWHGRGVLLAAVCGALILPALQWLVLLSAGLWEGYVFWNWTFNLRGFMDGAPLDGDFFRKLLLSNALVFPFALLAWRSRRLLIVIVWLSTLILLYPRFGEIHAMAHLPFTAVMSGVVLSELLGLLADVRLWDTPRQILAGLLIALGFGWLWTGAASYIPLEIGVGQILGYSEFEPLAQNLRERVAPGDTLFILPETDSTPQLHPLTNMPPPGTWIKGWRWYFRPAHVVPRLEAEWDESPPTWVIVFPALIRPDNSGIQPLLARVERDYQLQFSAAGIFGHGHADVYRLRSPAP